MSYARRVQRRLLGRGSSMVLAIATLLALVLTVVFAVRVGQHLQDLRSQADKSIQPWMDVPYVAHSYQVPQQVLFEALGLPARPPKKIAHQPIRKIASDQGRTVGEVQDLSMNAIKAYKGDSASANGQASADQQQQQLIAALEQYELPLLFGATLISAVGVPLPTSLLLVAAGSFSEQGELDLWWILGMALGGVVLGDLIGYGLGRWGARGPVARVSRWAGGEARLRSAEEAMQRRGGLAVFLSRWLLTPIGPALNLTSGISGYPWNAFLIWDLAGQAIWVGAYVWLGRLFSDRLQAMSDLLGDLVWLIIGLVALIGLGWKLSRRLLRPKPKRNGEQQA